MNLLEKTRKINALLQKADRLDFNIMAELLRELIQANAYIVSADGEVCGYALTEGFECGVMRREVLERQRFPKSYLNRIKKLKETSANIAPEKECCTFLKKQECCYKDKKTVVVPILNKGERLGTLILAKSDGAFGDEDLLLAEYVAVTAGMAIMYERELLAAENESKRAVMQVAISSLSYSEYEAIMSVLKALDGMSEGLLVTSKIADDVGITRSVIVNALRKFASAGLIETKSLGMKGTRIKVLSEFLLELAPRKPR